MYQVEGDLPERPSSQSGSCAVSGYAGPEAVYVLESPMDGAVEIRLEGDDPLLYVRTDCEDPTTEVVCNDDFEGPNSTVFLRVSAGTTYYLFADVFSEDAVSPFVLTVDTDPAPPKNHIPDGVWEAPMYGIVLTSEDDVIEWFEISDLSCFLWMDGLIHNFGSIITDADLTDEGKLALFLSGGLVPVVLDSADALPALCADGGTPMAGDDAYERDPLLLYDIFTTTFRDHYPFFDERAVDWDSITESYRGAVTSDISDEALFDVFAEMIQPLGDYHVYIDNGETSVEAGVPPAIEMLLAEFEAQGGDDFFEYFWEQITLMAENAFSYLIDDVSGDPETFAWGHLADDVGYLRIIEFDEYTDVFTAALEAALDDLSDTETLVIDIRINFGGGDHLGLITAGHFTDIPVDALKVNVRFKDDVTGFQTVGIDPLGERYPGQVVVMTSENTPSAAEVFTLMMKALPQVTLFGENTMGIIGSRMHRLLPNGWTFGVTKEIIRTSDGELFEATGVPPDAPATPMIAPLDDRLMGIDVGMEALLSWLGI